MHQNQSKVQLLKLSFYGEGSQFNTFGTQQRTVVPGLFKDDKVTSTGMLIESDQISKQ